MKITNIDSFIEEFKNGRDIWSRASIELAVREISRLKNQVQELEVQMKSKDIIIENQQNTIEYYAKKLLDYLGEIHG